MKAAQIKCASGRKKGRKKAEVEGGGASTGMMALCPAWVKLSGPDLGLTPVGLFNQYDHADR